MLRRQRDAVHLVREERVSSGQDLGERDAARVVLLLPSFDASVETGEEDIARALRDTGFLEQACDRRPAPARSAHRLEQPRLAHDVRFDERAAVPGALHRDGRLDRRAPADVVEGQ